MIMMERRALITTRAHAQYFLEFTCIRFETHVFDLILLLTGSFPDVVHAVDLEISIRYALTVEIPMQQLIDEAKMKVIFQYLELIIRYLPLRENIINFLKALREWPIQMDLRTIKSTDFSHKVTELMSIHHPFDATPEDYIGCKGSQPHFRGKRTVVSFDKCDKNQINLKNIFQFFF